MAEKGETGADADSADIKETIRKGRSVMGVNMQRAFPRQYPKSDIVKRKEVEQQLKEDLLEVVGDTKEMRDLYDDLVKETDKNDQKNKHDENASKDEMAQILHETLVEEADLNAKQSTMLLQMGYMGLAVFDGKMMAMTPEERQDIVLSISDCFLNDGSSKTTGKKMLTWGKFSHSEMAKLLDAYSKAKEEGTLPPTFAEKDAKKEAEKKANQQKAKGSKRGDQEAPVATERQADAEVDRADDLVAEENNKANEAEDLVPEDNEANEAEDLVPEDNKADVSKNFVLEEDNKADGNVKPSTKENSKEESKNSVPNNAFEAVFLQSLMIIRLLIFPDEAPGDAAASITFVPSDPGSDAAAVRNQDEEELDRKKQPKGKGQKRERAPANSEETQPKSRGAAVKKQALDQKNSVWSPLLEKQTQLPSSGMDAEERTDRAFAKFLQDFRTNFTNITVGSTFKSTGEHFGTTIRNHLLSDMPQALTRLLRLESGAALVREGTLGDAKRKHLMGIPKGLAGEQIKGRPRLLPKDCAPCGGFGVSKKMLNAAPGQSYVERCQHVYSDFVKKGLAYVKGDPQLTTSFDACCESLERSTSDNWASVADQYSDLPIMLPAIAFTSKLGSNQKDPYADAVANWNFVVLLGDMDDACGTHISSASAESRLVRKALDLVRGDKVGIVSFGFPHLNPQDWQEHDSCICPTCKQRWERLLRWFMMPVKLLLGKIKDASPFAFTFGDNLQQLWCSATQCSATELPSLHSLWKSDASADKKWAILQTLASLAFDANQKYSAKVNKKGPAKKAKPSAAAAKKKGQKDQEAREKLAVELYEQARLDQLVDIIDTAATTTRTTAVVNTIALSCKSALQRLEQEVAKTLACQLAEIPYNTCGVKYLVLLHVSTRTTELHAQFQTVQKQQKLTELLPTPPSAPAVADVPVEPRKDPIVLANARKCASQVYDLLGQKADLSNRTYQTLRSRAQNLAYKTALDNPAWASGFLQLKGEQRLKEALELKEKAKGEKEQRFRLLQPAAVTKARKTKSHKMKKDAKDDSDMTEEDKDDEEDRSLQEDKLLKVLLKISPTATFPGACGKVHVGHFGMDPTAIMQFVHEALDKTVNKLVQKAFQKQLEQNPPSSQQELQNCMEMASGQARQPNGNYKKAWTDERQVQGPRLLLFLQICLQRVMLGLPDPRNPNDRQKTQQQQAQPKLQLDIKTSQLKLKEVKWAKKVTLPPFYAALLLCGGLQRSLLDRLVQYARVKLLFKGKKLQQQLDQHRSLLSISTDGVSVHLTFGRKDANRGGRKGAEAKDDAVQQKQTKKRDRKNKNKKEQKKSRKKHRQWKKKPTTSYSNSFLTQSRCRHLEWIEKRIKFVFSQLRFFECNLTHCLSSFESHFRNLGCCVVADCRNERGA